MVGAPADGSADPGWEPLPWDSAFFDLSVAKVTAVDEGFVGADEGCAAAGTDVAYALVPTTRPAVVVAAVGRGWVPVDIRVELDRPVRRDDLDLGRRAGLVPVRPEHHDRLVELARSSFVVSRFYNDPRFDERRCGDLYEHWFRRSLAGERGEVVLTNPDGTSFVTVRTVERGVGTVDLIAVDPSERGSGTGRQLAHGVLGWLAEQGCRRLVIATQLANRSAVRLYEGLGCRTSSSAVWLHRWYR